MGHRPRTCTICGDIFIPTTGNQKTCSTECREKLNVERNRMLRTGYEPKKCVICRKAFKPTSGGQKTCSPECRKSRRNESQTEYRREYRKRPYAMEAERERSAAYHNNNRPAAKFFQALAMAGAVRMLDNREG